MHYNFSYELNLSVRQSGFAANLYQKADPFEQKTTSFMVSFGLVYKKTIIDFL